MKMLAGILFEILIVFQVLEQCAILRNTLLVELFFAFEQTNSVANFDHSDQITPDKEERKDDDQRRQRLGLRLLNAKRKTIAFAIVFLFIPNAAAIPR